MDKESFELMSIEEQVKIINNFGGLKKTEEEIGINAKTLGKALKRAKYKYDRTNNIFKIKNKLLEKSKINERDQEKESCNKGKTNENDQEKESSDKDKKNENDQEKESSNKDELSSENFKSDIDIDELSQKLIDSINIDVEPINLILENINELKEMLKEQIYQSDKNTRQEATNIKQALENLPKTIETLERTFRINLDVAENFDEFYKGNKGFRVQDLISLALQELIDKYK